MVMTQQRTRLKCRILATLNKYGLCPSGYSDPYGAKARQDLEKQLDRLPQHTRGTTILLLEQLDFIQRQIADLECRLKALLDVTPEMQRLMTVPGVGLILASVIVLEIGDVSRFRTPERLASYAGTVPRIHASGQTLRHGRVRPDVNHYLKWAFAEAANSVSLHRGTMSHRHACKLYLRVRARKGHQKAICATARHFAEATFYILKKEENYREPAVRKGASSGT